MDLIRSLGIVTSDTDPVSRQKQLRRYINLKLAAMGQPTYGDRSFLNVAHDLLESYRERTRLLTGTLTPADQRLQTWLEGYLADSGCDSIPRLPSDTFVLDRHSLARELSLPPDSNEYHSNYVESYRVTQGVLHNPLHDRRTTKGVFHIAEGGLPIPADKKAVPKATFANLLKAALTPPDDIMQLPFTSTSEEKASCWASLLLRPTVCPEVPDVSPEKSLEVRFFAPGSLVSNLDFVESIFGNAGAPYLPENDAALDVEHWTGHTGCVILAPHIRGLRKKDLGLPPFKKANKRQKADGMCYKEDDELYNDGLPFKICARNEDGVIVTLIADNYFGYCKKEVKTQISFSSNLYGATEEEHAGGALAFASYSLGEMYCQHQDAMTHTFADATALFSSMMDIQSNGYAIDKKYPNIIYIQEDAIIYRDKQSIEWVHLGQKQKLPLLAAHTYVYPSGFKVRMEKHTAAPSWRLVGTVSEGVFCHKPCTVSGGGKSEISKSISDAIIYGPIFTADMEKDFDIIDELFKRDYSDRLLEKFRPDYSDKPSRPLLSQKRSLGSVIKLFTPSPNEFTDEYNAWLETIPSHITAMLFIIKRFYADSWEDNWRMFFNVDTVNGGPGHELRFMGRKLVANYLRIGVSTNGSWRTHKLRQDFMPADKIQMEDDISVSTIVNTNTLHNVYAEFDLPSCKLVTNCENRFFQRPDEAIVRGFDKQAESDLAGFGGHSVFISNYKPMTQTESQELVQNSVDFSAWTQPMQDLIKKTAENEEEGHEDTFVVSSAHPRIVNGKPTKNPRYLQTSEKLLDQRDSYIAEVGARLKRRVPVNKQVINPVNVVLPGRRNNPAEPGIRPLAVYNPIHYQELPELFMDFICSLTGKSPSTTGAGSEGALTKGPFNALRATADLNNALLGFILCGYQGFSSAAGYVGHERRVDHDVSLLIPELWCRLHPHEYEPQSLIADGHLEKLEDFEHDGQMVHASRLGYRITTKFLHTFFGRLFDQPSEVFDDIMLKPELQSLENFADGINNIVEAQQRVAQKYLDDGSVEEACPPLRALLHIMATGSYEGKTITDSEVRDLFTRESVLNSEWYAQRLRTKQQRDSKLWERHCNALSSFLERTSHTDEAERLNVHQRLAEAKEKLEEIDSASYLENLSGTLGAHPMGA